MLGTQAKDGFVGLVVSCEMEQPALQKLLYDLEAGMPFLFVDQLDVQVPQTTAANEGGIGTDPGRARRFRAMAGQQIARLQARSAYQLYLATPLPA